MYRRRRPIIILAGVAASVALETLAAMAGATDTKPADLPPRDYHIDTTLVGAGRPEVVVVSSARRPAYQAIAEGVRTRIKELSGVRIDIVDADDVTTTDVLGRRNAIVLGNLVTSRFVERLYWEWYTLLDLWYPGPGGHVVRTLHDPYGTGRNIIFLGGSDDEGVAAAADRFCRLLVKGDPLKVGWLAEINLGENHRLPPVGDWIEPRLRLFATTLPFRHSYVLSYTEASRAGLIHYYSNSPDAARRFRDLALDTDLITTSSHYTAHMHYLVWDLIEESPAFTDADRRAITARLLAHARGSDGTAGVPNLVRYPVRTRMLDRHSSMQAICTLAGSRYFGKHWPAEEWRNNVEAVKRYFDPQLTIGKCDSDLSGRGTYTYPECVLMPSLLLGDRRVIDSGALRRMAELCLMHCDNTGYMPDTGQNSFDSYPRATLACCAALLNDAGFLATMPLRDEAERIGGFTNLTMEFLHGQAWATGLQPRPMDKMIGVYHLPLTPFEHQLRGKSVPVEKSLDKLTMRAGFGRHDQYLLLDGLHGGPDEKPWPNANAIAHFSQNGRIFLVSDVGGENPANHNTVTVSKEGMGELPARAASLEQVADLPTFGFSHSRLDPHMFGAWDRHIFWRKGGWFVVLDRLRMREAGRYSFECHWRTIGEPQINGTDYTSAVQNVGDANAPRDILNIKNAERLPVRRSEVSRGPVTELDTKAWSTYCSRRTLSRMRQVADRTMDAGDEQVFTNLIYVGGDSTKADYVIRKTSDHAFAIAGDESVCGGLTADGVCRLGPLEIRGVAFCVSPESVAVVAGKRIQLGNTVIAASGPCGLELNTVAGTVSIDTPESLTVTVDGRDHACCAGVTTIPVALDRVAVKTLGDQVRDNATSGEVRTPASVPSEQLPPLAIAWVFRAGTPVTCLAAGDVDGDGQQELLVGGEKGTAACLDSVGRERWAFRTAGAVRALAFATLEARPTVLVGSDDEQVHAISADGARVYWTHHCAVPADRFRQWPWWTTQGKGKVQAILVADLDNDHRNEVYVGTGGGCVEALSDRGVLRWSRPIEWGIPDRFAVAPAADGVPSLLVANSTISCADVTWRLTPNGKYLSINAFDNGRGSWDMATVPCLRVLDLEHDGKLEVIIGRNGACNEVAVYDAATGRRRWLHALADEVGVIEAVDVDRDGIKEVIVGSRSAWLMVFAADGRRVQSTMMPHEIVAVAEASDGLLVGCADARVYRVDASGRMAASRELAGMPIGPFVRAGNVLVIGDSGGTVTAMSAGQ